MRSHHNYEYFVQHEMRGPENYTTDENPLQLDTVTVNNLARGLPLIVTISIKHDKNILEKLITKDQKEGKLQYNCQNLLKKDFDRGGNDIATNWTTNQTNSLKHILTSVMRSNSEAETKVIL